MTKKSFNKQNICLMHKHQFINNQGRNNNVNTATGKNNGQWNDFVKDADYDTLNIQCVLQTMQWFWNL